MHSQTFIFSFSIQFNTTVLFNLRIMGNLNLQTSWRRLSNICNIDLHISHVCIDISYWYHVQQLHKCILFCNPTIFKSNCKNDLPISHLSYSWCVAWIQNLWYFNIILSKFFCKHPKRTFFNFKYCSSNVSQWQNVNLACKKIVWSEQKHFWCLR